HRYIQKLWKGGKVMSKLTPKNEIQKVYKDWDTIDTVLKYVFEDPIRTDYVAYIYPKEFKIPKDEIIQELQNNGYSVTEVEDCLEIR
ncbi:hypothetical protein AB8A01_09665, partial [Streptococcus pyogenes]